MHVTLTLMRTHTQTCTNSSFTWIRDGNRKGLESWSNIIECEGMRPHVTVREERGVTKRGTVVYPVVAVRIMMIRIQQKNDEGHSDYISDETDDNDDVP